MQRGRHQSTCKDGKRTIQKLQSIPGVQAVILGVTSGRKSGGKGKPVGYFKLQRKIETGFKGVLQCSYGAQDLSIIVAEKDRDSVKKAIENLYPKD